MIITGIAHAPIRLLERSNLPSGELICLAKLALQNYHATYLITSLAQGWEQALAKAALEAEIPYTVAVPFPGRDANWKREERVNYYDLIARANKVVRIYEGYHVLATLEGHRWQVEQANLLVCLWDYDFQGETYEITRYATQSGKQVVNLWEDWSHLREMRKTLRVRTIPDPQPPVEKGARVYEKKSEV